MKHLMFASLVWWVSSTAFACPDISGIYVAAEGTKIKFLQAECASLTRFIGEDGPNGTITWPDAGLTFKMDGQPQCGIRDFCTTTTADADGIHFTLNFNAGVNTDDHGACDQRGYVLNLDTKNVNLIGNYSVLNCADKFTGTASKTFRKL